MGIRVETMMKWRRVWGRKRLFSVLLLPMIFAAVASIGAQSCEQVRKGEVGTDACLACHDGRKAPDQSQFRTSFHLAVGCEACHGPGLLHVRAAGRAGAFIDNPGEMTGAELTALCGRCHAEESAAFGRSVHAKEDVMKCVQCHDIHGASLTTLPYKNNQLCLNCHAPHGFETDGAVEAHTFHPVDPEGTGASRCTTCHMPPSRRVNQDQGSHDHSFRTLAPITSSQAGVHPAPPNSCSGITGCHGDAASTAPLFNVDSPADNDALQAIYDDRYGS